MRKIYFLLLMLSCSLMAMAESITLSSSTVSYRAHNTTEGYYIVQFTSENGYSVNLQYSSDVETGSFSTEVDTWESYILSPASVQYYVNGAQITVAIDADGAYHLTGTLDGENSEDATDTPTFILDLHRSAPLQAKDSASYTIPNATFMNAYDANVMQDYAIFHGTTSDNKKFRVAYNAWASYTGELEPALMIQSGTQVNYGGKNYGLERLVSGNVVVNDDKTFTLTFRALFKDTIQYDVTMKAPIPAYTSTDTVVFSNLTVEVNMMSEDLEIHGSNDSLDVYIYQQNGVYADGLIQGQGVAAMIDEYETGNSYLSYFVSANLNVVNNPDSQVVVADVYASNGVLYHFIMNYILPTATDTVQITINNAQFNNMANSGQYGLNGFDATHQVALTVQMGSFEQGETLTDENIKDYLVDQYSYVAYVEGGDTVRYRFLKGTVSASRSMNDTVTISANVLGEDAHYYVLTLSGVWERQHLGNDTKLGDINQTFTANDKVVLDVAAALNNLAATFEVTDAANTRSLALNFFIDPIDLDEANLRIPAGEYPIDNSYYYGSCEASTGLSFDWDLWDYVVMPCLYVEQSATNPQEFNYYFLVDGTVTVSYEGNAMNIVVDAYNSYDRHVVVTCTNMPTALDEVVSTVKAVKRIENGQLVIEHNGRVFNAQGLLVK